MIRKLTFLALIMTTLLVSCSKEEESPNSGKCQISYIERSDTTGKYKRTCSMKYDKNGRLSEVVSSSDTVFTSFKASYSPGKVVLDTKYWSDRTYFLDGQERTTRYTNVEYYEWVDLKYSPEGYLVELTNTADYSQGPVTDTYVGEGPQPYPAITTYKMTYTDGNLTRMSMTSTPYNSPQEWTFEYNNDEAEPITEINNPLDRIYEFYPLNGYTGKISKNQLTKITMGNPVVGGSHITTFTYKKDESGKIRTIREDYKYIWKQVGKPDRIDHSYTAVYNLKYTCD